MSYRAREGGELGYTFPVWHDLTLTVAKSTLRNKSDKPALPKGRKTRRQAGVKQRNKMTHLQEPSLFVPDALFWWRVLLFLIWFDSNSVPHRTRSCGASGAERNLDKMTSVLVYVFVCMFLFVLFLLHFVLLVAMGRNFNERAKESFVARKISPSWMQRNVKLKPDWVDASYFLLLILPFPLLALYFWSFFHLL